MCKTYVVLSYAWKGNYNPTTGKMGGMSNVTGYTLLFFDTFAAAQLKADEFARNGSMGVIYESKEFRWVQPAPVVVEEVECCDTK